MQREINKEMMGWLTRFFSSIDRDMNIGDYEAYGPKRNGFPYKIYLKHKNEKKVFKMDTCGYSLVSKSEVNFKNKNELIEMGNETVFYELAFYPSEEKRFIERKILSFICSPTFEQREEFNDDDDALFSCDESICKIGKDFDELEPKEITLASIKKYQDEICPF